MKCALNEISTTLNNISLMNPRGLPSLSINPALGDTFTVRLALMESIIVDIMSFEYFPDPVILLVFMLWPSKLLVLSKYKSLQIDKSSLIKYIRIINQ